MTKTMMDNGQNVISKAYLLRWAKKCPKKEMLTSKCDVGLFYKMLDCLDNFLCHNFRQSLFMIDIYTIIW